MKKSILDVVKENEGKTMVMAMRHFSYLTGPTACRAIDEYDVFARNYSETEPSILFLCDRAGIERGWRHGKALADMGVVVDNIFASHQGRGPDSGLRISEGHHEATGKWLSVACHKAVDYPIYNREFTHKALQEDGDPVVAKWMNGERDGLIKSDTPETFRGRTIGFIEAMLKRTGLTLITTHFEFVVMTHAYYVEGRDLGNISEEYAPQKGGGVLIIREADGSTSAHDYDADWNVIE